MRRLIATSLMLLILSPIIGCKSVESDHLIGEPLTSDQAEKFEGVWQFEDSVLHVKHVEGGRFVAAGLEWDDDGFEVEHMEVVVTHHAGARFLHVLAEEDEDEHDADDGETHAEAGDNDEENTEADSRPWIIAGMLTRMESDVIVLNITDFDEFTGAVEADALQGEADEDGNTLHIQGDKQALDDLIDPEALRQLFHIDKPIVIIRLSD